MLVVLGFVRHWELQRLGNESSESVTENKTNRQCQYFSRQTDRRWRNSLSRHFNKVNISLFVFGLRRWWKIYNLLLTLLVIIPLLLTLLFYDITRIYKNTIDDYLNITTDTYFPYCRIQQDLQTSFCYTKVYDITVFWKPLWCLW